MPTSHDGQRPILVVDDDPDILDSLRDFLEIEGFAVDLAANGLQALARLQQKPAPSLVLLDMRMPLMDGWTFLASMRQRPALAAIPVAACTADGLARVDGVVATLRKPFEIEDVLRLLRQYCT